MNKKEKILKLKKEIVEESVDESKDRKRKNESNKLNKKRRIEIAFDFVVVGILIYALIFYLIYSKNLIDYLLPALVGVLFYFTTIFFSFTLHQMCKDLEMKKRKLIYLIIYFLVMIILTPITIFSLLAGYFLSDDDFFERINIKLFGKN